MKPIEDKLKMRNQIICGNGGNLKQILHADFA